jgi:hypothetical protein
LLLAQEQGQVLLRKASRYCEFPKRVRVPKFFPDELKSVTTKKEFKKLASKIELVADNSKYIAEGDNDKAFNYEREGIGDLQPDITAQEWIGIKPDYYD